MHCQDLRNLTSDPGKILQLFIKNNCFFAKEVLTKDNRMIFIVLYSYKALLDIRGEMLPFYTFEQLQKRYAYWSLFTKP